ncbi:ATP-binding protein [Streptomyces griseoluteus]|nr:hypothetical protein GCM10017776_32290 [Streptomyces griseoluteus]
MADQGPGIPPASRQRPFERFPRGPHSTGSGLGLTLVAQQAALHRGSVGVTGGPDGTGARFEVPLPLDGTAVPGRRDRLTGTAGADRSQGFPEETSWPPGRRAAPRPDPDVNGGAHGHATKHPHPPRRPRHRGAAGRLGRCRVRRRRLSRRRARR